MRFNALSVVGVLGMTLWTSCPNPAPFTAFVASGGLFYGVTPEGRCTLFGENVEIRMGDNVLRADRAAFRIIDGALDEIVLDGRVRLTGEVRLR